MTRPKKAPDDKREIVLRVRVTKEERAQLQGAADHERLDLSTWLRRLGLNEAATLTEHGAKKAKERVASTSVVRSDQAHVGVVRGRRLNVHND